MFKNINYIDYGKLRFSVGKTGKTAKTPYVTASRYVPVSTTGGGFALSFFAGNPKSHLNLPRTTRSVVK